MTFAQEACSGGWPFSGVATFFIIVGSGWAIALIISSFTGKGL